MTRDAIHELITAAKALSPSGEIGDGKVAHFHHLAERDALAVDLARTRTAKARLVRWGALALGRILGLRRRLTGAEAESRAAREGLRTLSGRVADMQARLDERVGGELVA